jgi:hypothetical protein
MEQRAGKQQQGENNKTTRADNRGKQEENRGTELNEETPQPRDTCLASTCVRSPVPATWEMSVRRSVDRDAIDENGSVA